MLHGRAVAITWVGVVLALAGWACESSRSPGGFQPDLIPPTISLTSGKTPPAIDTQKIASGMHFTVSATDNLALNDIRLIFLGRPDRYHRHHLLQSDPAGRDAAGEPRVPGELGRRRPHHDRRPRDRRYRELRRRHARHLPGQRQRAERRAAVPGARRARVPGQVRPDPHHAEQTGGSSAWDGSSAGGGVNRRRPATRSRSRSRSRRPSTSSTRWSSSRPPGRLRSPVSPRTRNRRGPPAGRWSSPSCPRRTTSRRPP